MPIKAKTIQLIDELKATCATYGMGNDGNEYKIITQVFLYKFLNDKFGYELKRAKRLSQPPSGRRPMLPLAKRNGCYCKHRYHQKYLFYSPTTLSLIYGISRAKATSTLSLTIR